MDGIIERPKLFLKVSYEKDLSIKDTIDILDLLRKAINNTYRKYGIKITGINKYTTIKSIKEGSIDIEAVLEIVANAFTIVSLCLDIYKSIKEIVEATHKKIEQKNNHYDRPIYVRNKIIINGKDNNVNIIINNSHEYCEPIYIDNKDK